MASIIPHGPNKRSLLISYYYNKEHFRISPGLKNNPKDIQRAREIVEKIELDIELDNHPSTEKEARLKYVCSEKKIRSAQKEMKKKRVKKEVIKKKTASELWKDYQAYKETQLKAEKIAEATYAKFEWAVKQLAQFPFNLEWDKQKKFLAKFTNNKQHSLLSFLSAFQNYSNKITGDNGNRYSIEMGSIKREKEIERTSISEDWLKSFDGPAEVKRYLTFLLYSGCRPNEALALRWCDIDGDKILIWRSNRKTTKTKTKKNRYVPFSEKWIFHSHLKDAIGEIKTGKEYIFPLDYVLVSGYLYREKKVTLYSFRHGFADLCAERGVSPEGVAILMGNSPLIASNVYTSPEAKLNGIVGKNSS